MNDWKEQNISEAGAKEKKAFLSREWQRPSTNRMSDEIHLNNTALANTISRYFDLVNSTPAGKARKSLATKSKNMERRVGLFANLLPFIKAIRKTIRKTIRRTIRQTLRQTLH
ncbi:hypothetical protein MBLNU457_g2416t1 [Dothideomycetes sp. NU457]